MFGQLDVYIEEDITGRVTHMERDLYLRNSLLFSEPTAIKSTNGTHVTLIAGRDMTTGYHNGIGPRARFSMITSFLQINSTDIVLADTLAHCLRLLTRTNHRVAQYAGKCQEEGTSDSSFSDAKFQAPKYMVRGEKDSIHKLFVVDETSNAIRVVNTELKTVETLFTSDEITGISGIVLDSESSNTLLILSSTYIKKVSITGTNQSPLPTVFVSSGNGLQDGSFAEASTNSPERILAIGKGVYLTSGEKLSSILRVVDVVTESISSICQGHSFFYTAGSISECLIPSPTGIALIRNYLYVGGFAIIYRLSSMYNYNNIIKYVFILEI